MYDLTMLMVRRLDRLWVLQCVVLPVDDVVLSFPLVLTIVVSGIHVLFCLDVVVTSVVVSDHTFLVMLMFVILIDCVVMGDGRRRSVDVDRVYESVIARLRFLPVGNVPSFHCIL